METDVLVIGGRLTGMRAATAAVRVCAQVVAADIGYCGTSGMAQQACGLGRAEIARGLDALSSTISMLTS